jgi:hypothetical protein
VTPWGALLALSLGAGAGGHALDAAALPACSNRVVAEVVKRVGCTLGDYRCWSKRGGFCADWVEARVAADRRGGTPAGIQPEEVRPGDVAVFTARAHFAYVERVVRDSKGRPVAIDVSEYNYGTCWVDSELLVTDKYKVVNRRSSVALKDVDGGFLRPGPAAR